MPVFLAPIYLFAAAAAVLPVFLHLLHRRRPSLVPLGTTRFLRQAMVYTRRSRRLSNWLLLLLRVALVLLLTLAFARPTLRHFGFVGSQRRTLVVVLDTGAGMRLTEDVALFEQARGWVFELIDSLRPGDRVAVVAADTEPRFLLFPPVSDHARVRAALAEIAPGYGSVNMQGATREVLRRLPSEVAAAGLELHLFSDFRTHAWPDDGLERLPSEIGEGTMLFFNRVRPGVLANAGIADFEPVVEPANRGGELLRGQAELRAARDFIGEVRLRLLLDDEERHSLTVRLAPEQGATASLVAPLTLPPELPEIVGSLRLSEDVFAEDNAFFFSLPRRHEMGVLLLDRSSDEAAGQGAAALRRALAVGRFGRTSRPPKRLAMNQFPEEFDGGIVDVALVNGYGGLSAAAVRRLRELAGAGATVAVFPAGDPEEADFFNRFGGFARLRSRLLAHSELQIETLLEGEGRPHPLEARIKRILPFGLQVPTRRRWQFADLPEAAGRILSYADGSPFLWGIDVGKGRLWVSSVGLDRACSDWALSPLFVVGLQEMIGHGLGRGRREATLRVGEPWPWFWPGDELELAVEIESPAGERQSLTLSRPDSARPFMINGFERIGHYRLRAGGRERTVAVNLPETELRFDYLPPRELAFGLPADRVWQAGDWPRQADHLRLLERGRALWPWLLLFAFLLALGEELLANWFGRTRKPPESLAKVVGRTSSAARGVGL